MSGQAMSNSSSDFENIDLATLETTTGGAGLGDAVSATTNFAKGFAGGALHGTGAKTDQIERFGNRNDTGFKPGVETGMMANMAMGKVGDLVSMGADYFNPSKQ
jgi:hypothetical protein